MFTYEIIVMDTTDQCSDGHLEARVTCLDTGQVRVLNWDGIKKHQMTPLTDNAEKLGKFNTIFSNRLSVPACIAPKPVILYSQTKNTMDEFSAHVSQYMNKGNYSPNKNKFSMYFNNCSDAVNFTLDYFFPDNDNSEEKMQAFKLRTFPLYITTCGLSPCFFGTPPGINQPKDILKKARWLSFQYGKKPYLQEVSAPLHQRMRD